MLLTAMHDNPNQGFWQANAKNNPPAIIKESTCLLYTSDAPCHYQRKYGQSG